MRLDRFEIKYFRSIKDASVSDIGRLLILIGANNEGKSNILRAVRLALSAMQDVRYYNIRRGRMPIRRTYFDSDEGIEYEWERDFPVNLQNHARLKDKSTQIRLTFQLSDREMQEFHGAFGLNTNGTIPVLLRFQKKELEVKIVKQGPAAQAFTERSTQIARFISERLSFVYIPAVRTSRFAMDIIESTIRQRIEIAQAPILKRVEAELRAAEKRALEDISEELRSTLSSFVPQITAVEIDPIRRFSRSPERNLYDVRVNDGHMTSINSKGDGVQSLVSLALMRSQGDAGRSDTIFAIEEPEAHLNSDAIYKLKEAVMSGGAQNQAILTTHSPIFAHSGRMSSNIIVRESTATPAKSIAEIRQALGVRVPENLVSAGGFLFVEGPLDIDFIDEILRRDAKLRALLDSRFLVLEALKGAANLIHNCRHYTQLSCEVFAFLDNDQEGKAAFDAAFGAGYISIERVRYTISGRRSTSELEDMFDEAHYADVMNEFGLRFDEQYFADGAKWSFRTRRLADRLGVPWNDDIAEQAKVRIGAALRGSYWDALSDRGKDASNGIIKLLKDGLKD